MVNTGCVLVLAHKYARWIFGASDARWYELGSRWRTESGELACTSTAYFLLREADPGPDCDFGWQAQDFSGRATGVGCDPIYATLLGTDLIYDDAGTGVWEEWGYAASWSGPSRWGYSVHDAPTVLSYEWGQWVGWAYEGMVTPDWYTIDDGDQRWLGYEESYNSAYAYVYVAYIFP